MMRNGFAGVDVSKQRLDAYLTEDARCTSFANDEAGIEALVEVLLKADPKRIGSNRRIGTDAGG